MAVLAVSDPVAAPAAATVEAPAAATVEAPAAATVEAPAAARTAVGFQGHELLGATLRALNLPWYSLNSVDASQGTFERLTLITESLRYNRFSSRAFQIDRCRL